MYGNETTQLISSSNSELGTNFNCCNLKDNIHLHSCAMQNHVDVILLVNIEDTIINV